MLRRPLPLTLFPYTTLFRSPTKKVAGAVAVASTADDVNTYPAFVPLANTESMSPGVPNFRSEEQTLAVQSHNALVCSLLLGKRSAEMAEPSLAERRDASKFG